MKCPICAALVKNIQLHFDINVKCSAKIDHLHFKRNFEEFSKQQKKEKDRIRQLKQRNAKKKDNAESYSAMKEQQRQDKQNLRDRKKVENEESHSAMKEKNRQHNQNLRDRQRNEGQESQLAMKKRNRIDNQNHRDKKDKNMDETGRLANFHRAVLFGPILLAAAVLECFLKMELF